MNGTETDAWGLKEGMTVTATKIVEEPGTAITTQKAVAGRMPPDVPVLIVK